MKTIVCNKPCNIGGRRFAIGETVPESRIDAARAKRLQALGLVTVINAPDSAEPANKPKQAEKPAAATSARKRGKGA